MLAYTFFPALLFVCDPTFANVLFLPRGGIYASFDHWTLHLPIETRTSWTFANKLEYRIRLFKNKFATNFAEHRHNIRSDLADSIWGKFMIESDSLDREMNVTMAALQHLKTPNPAREKRSLLPFVGDALSSLFGTATSTEIQDILSRINDLSDSRSDMLNVVDNTVTMLNQTIVDVSINREMTNRLTNVTNYLTDRIDLLKNVVLDGYLASQLESEMDAVFTDIISTVREFRKSIMDMETIFALSETGILPRSLLPPPPQPFCENIGRHPKSPTPRAGTTFFPVSDGFILFQLAYQNRTDRRSNLRHCNHPTVIDQRSLQRVSGFQYSRAEITRRTELSG